MFDLQVEKVPLPQKLAYKYGAVTYEVTAHFCSETESLKSKINGLIKLDLQKSSPIRTFAAGLEGDVK